MRFWDTALARAIFVAPPLALLAAMLFMVDALRSTHIATADIIGTMLGLMIVLTFVLGFAVVLVNEVWWLIRSRHRR